MPNEAKRAERWREMARRTLRAAERLHSNDDYRGCANRAYYAAYQAATAVCVEHGDEPQFVHGWNNPSHDQLPGLIERNGTLPHSSRRTIKELLNFLRETREDADYRPGRTVNREISLLRVQKSRDVLEMLGVFGE